MRYFQTTPEQKDMSENPNDIKFVDSDEDEITARIPIEKFCQINNASLIFDDPAAIVRIVLLRAKPEYSNYFGSHIYSVFVRTENNETWFGVSVKNPHVGLMRWEKAHWDKIYSFSLSMTMQEE